MFCFTNLIDCWNRILQCYIIIWSNKVSSRQCTLHSGFLHFCLQVPLGHCFKNLRHNCHQGMESILKFAVNLMIQNESNLLALSLTSCSSFKR